MRDGDQHKERQKECEYEKDVGGGPGAAVGVGKKLELERREPRAIEVLNTFAIRSIKKDIPCLRIGSVTVGPSELQNEDEKKPVACAL